MAQQWNDAYSKTIGGKVSKKIGWADPFQQSIRDTAEMADSEDERIKQERAEFQKNRDNEKNEANLFQPKAKKKANNLQTGTVSSDKSLLN